MPNLPIIKNDSDEYMLTNMLKNSVEALAPIQIEYNQIYFHVFGSLFIFLIGEEASSIVG